MLKTDHLLICNPHPAESWPKKHMKPKKIWDVHFLAGFWFKRANIRTSLITEPLLLTGLAGAIGTLFRTFCCVGRGGQSPAASGPSLLQPVRRPHRTEGAWPWAAKSECASCQLVRVRSQWLAAGRKQKAPAYSSRNQLIGRCAASRGAWLWPPQLTPPNKSVSV